MTNKDIGKLSALTEINKDLFNRVLITDNRDGKNAFIPSILEIEFCINQKHTERFKEDWYILISIYTDGKLQILTEGIGNFVSNEQMNEILRIRNLIKDDQ